MKRIVWIALLFIAPGVAAQTGKFPPDSLINTHVIPHNTPVPQVVAMMRDFAGNLGVRCQFCHVGEGNALAQFDFASDQKRTKVVARQMMLMVQEVNRRIDTLPGRPDPMMKVTCATCHRGTSRPIPLDQLVGNDAVGAGADSAIRAYRALRTRYYGRDAYDFGEQSLIGASRRAAQAGKQEAALALLAVNEEFFPNSSASAVARANVFLVRNDTASAVAALRAALARDSTSTDARGRLRQLGQQP